METMRGSVIFVLGAPGAGKGTLCKRLAQEHGFKHLSIGDLLRQVVSSPNADKTIMTYVQRGELLSTELLFQTLRPHIEESNGRCVILLDGFPRRLDQAKEFEKVFRHPLLVLFFDCPEGLAEERVVHRLLGRDGDNYEMFKRYTEFLDLNPRILHHYGGKNMLVTVDTSGDADISYAKLLAVLQRRREWGALTLA